jgi:pimeloyl-ACP methyl ester carboxylesterase
MSLAGSLRGHEAFENLQLSSLQESSTSCFDDLVNAFDDEDVPGGNKTVKPPFVNLPTRGLHMKFDIKGPEHAPKLLYIPGVTDDLRKTLSMLHFEAFARNFRVLTCDLRNQGMTTPFMVDDYVPLETYVEDLMALVDEVFSPDEAFHVVGWSFGAALALLLARLYSKRVQSMALLAGGYWEPSTEHPRSLKPGGEELFGSDWTWIQTLSSYATMDAEKRCEQMLCHADARRTDSTFRQNMAPSFQYILDNFVKSENLTVCYSPRSCAELGKGVLAQEIALYVQGTPQVEDVSTPTIVIHGRHDGMHSVHRAAVLKEKMKSAMLIVLEDEGHVIVNAAVEAASCFMRPQTSIKPALEDREALSYAAANMAFDEVSAAYSKESFQDMLDAVFEKAGFSEKDKEERCHEICFETQKPILEKHGLPCPTSDVKEVSESWLGFSLTWVGWSEDPDCLSNPDCLVDLTSRRLEALEKAVVIERRKVYEKKLVEIGRAQSSSKQKMSRTGYAKPASGTSSAASIINREDFIKHSLFHIQSVDSMRGPLKLSGGPGYTADAAVKK